MFNTQLYESAVRKKFADQLFFSIVSEAFINALPFDEESKTDDKNILRTYCWNVCKSIDGITSLESAVSDDKTFKQNLFIGELYNLCMESAKACARRKTSEIKKDNDPELTFATAVDKATLNKDEYKEFAKKADKMNIDGIAEIIKKKTLFVIKDEQDAYEREKELDDKLEEALNDGKKDGEDEDVTPDKTSGASDEDTAQETADTPEDTKIQKGDPPEPETKSVVESYTDLVLGKDAPRHHMTIFSRLQDTAMEMAHLVKVHDDEDYLPIVEKVTFEAFLSKKSAPKIEQVVESLHSIASEEICNVSDAGKPKMALLVSIIVYTMMETLRTMGIFNPSASDIHHFVHRPITAQNVEIKDVHEAYTLASDILKNTLSRDLDKLDNNFLARELLQLKSAMEMAEEMLNHDPSNKDMIDVVYEAGNIIRKIEGIQDLRNQAAKEKTIANARENLVLKRQRSNDTAQFNKIDRLFRNNPKVREIRLLIKPTNMPGGEGKSYSSIIDAAGIAANGQTVQESFMNIEFACESSKDYINYLKERFDLSKMNLIDKPVKLVIADGKSTSYNLN